MEKTTVTAAKQIPVQKNQVDNRSEIQPRVTQAAKYCQKLVENVGKCIQGKQKQVEKVLACWLAGGHVLLEDVPGTGKTVLAKTLAKSVQTKFKRVQFTPDILPSDVIGSAIYSRKTEVFKFQKGPIFTAIFLADEINRATPRTQSALLESMAEGTCSAEGVTHQLSPIFFVLATQNPIEQKGTFPLPEAQLDRFMMKLSLGYPDPATEERIVLDRLTSKPEDLISAVWSEDIFIQIKKIVQKIVIRPELIHYMVQVATTTRNSDQIDIGASTRAILAWVECSRAMALIAGSSFVKPEHIKSIAEGVLAHRLSLSQEARIEGVNIKEALGSILSRTAIPTR